MNLFGVLIYRQQAGLISEGPIWVCFYGAWMHTGETLLGLLWNVVTEYRHDDHVVG